MFDKHPFADLLNNLDLTLLRAELGHFHREHSLEVSKVHRLSRAKLQAQQPVSLMKLFLVQRAVGVGVDRAHELINIEILAVTKFSEDLVQGLLREVEHLTNYINDRSLLLLFESI